MNSSIFDAKHTQAELSQNVAATIRGNDNEFDSALTISNVLVVLTAKIFKELSSQDNQKIATIVNTGKRQKFLDE